MHIMRIMQKRATLIFLHKTTLDNTQTNCRVTPRPLLPQLLVDKLAGNQGKPKQADIFNDYLREYQTLGVEFHATTSLHELCIIKFKNIPRDFNKGQQNFDLQ